MIIKKASEFISEIYRSDHAHISNNSNPNNVIEKKISFTKKGFDEFNEVAAKHKDDYRKMLSLIKDIVRNPDFWRPDGAGLGKSEIMKVIGRCSKRISKKVRLQYKANAEEVVIYSCIDHLGDK